MPTPLHLKPPTAAWIVRERKRLGLKPADVAARLAAMGLEVTEGTIKVWESNADRRPAPENLEGLERIFQSTAPRIDAPVDQGAILAALDRQTEAIAALAEAVRQLAVASIGGQDALQHELLRVLGAGNPLRPGHGAAEAQASGLEPQTPEGVGQ